MRGSALTRASRPPRRRALAIGAAALVVGSYVETASAADDPPGDSAVVQYAELVPSAGGPKAPGIGKKTTSPLPKRAREALERAPGDTAESLTKVATSSDYGAPAGTAKRVPPNELPATRAALDRTLEATVAAAAPVDDVRMIGLLLAMLAVVVGGATAAVRNRRF